MLEKDWNYSYVTPRFIHLLTIDLSKQAYSHQD